MPHMRPTGSCHVCATMLASLRAWHVAMVGVRCMRGRAGCRSGSAPPLCVVGACRYLKPTGSTLSADAVLLPPLPLPMLLLRPCDVMTYCIIHWASLSVGAIRRTRRSKCRLSSPEEACAPPPLAEEGGAMAERVQALGPSRAASASACCAASCRGGSCSDLLRRPWMGSVSSMMVTAASRPFG
jgi:hypothetical protein